MKKSFASLKKHEWILLIFSVLTVIASNLITENVNIITLIATVIGVTALIFVANGDVFGQILIIIFSLLYAVTSLKYRYYGEIITYLGMSAPIAALSVVSWLKHPYEKGKNEVEIHRLSKAQKWVIGTLTAAVTVLFYFVLKWLNTPNLIVSTVSIATSFLASGLMLYRSSYYALAYAVNDIVLISLWIYAAIDDISYLPMIVCFAIFLINDVYGFFSWKIREQIQRRGKQSNQRSKSL